MRKYLFFLLIIFSITVLNAELDLARLHYQGGGDWYNNPDMLPNLAKFANRKMQISINTEEKQIEPTDKKIADYPFIFMTGHGNIKFSDKAAAALRKHLLRGGFLYADDDYGMDESFRREIKKVFPEKELVELPANHEIFNCYFELGTIPKIHEHDKKRPQAFGIFDDFGRLMVLYTYETNISDGWAGPQVHNDPPEVRQKALKTGTNILYYIITQ